MELAVKWVGISKASKKQINKTITIYLKIRLEIKDLVS